MANIIIRGDKREERQKFVNSLRYRGRKRGAIAGSHLDNLVALRKTVILCWKHWPKFRAKDYIRVRSRGEPISTTGQCDVCRDYGPGNAMFVHETHNGVLANFHS